MTDPVPEASVLTRSEPTEAEAAIFGDLTQHSRSCQIKGENITGRDFDPDCTCSLGERRRWATAETMSAAWRKRAMEAETALQRAQAALPVPAGRKATDAQIDAGVEALRLLPFAGMIATLREKVEAAINAALSLPVPADRSGETPAARWREDGQPDPHGSTYDCERRALEGGQYTDDEVAFRTATLMRDDIRHEAVLLMAKDRIRWLSRKLVEATALLSLKGEGKS